MRNNRATILIIRKDQKVLKPKSITGFVLTHWKKCLALAILIIFSLGTLIGYLISDRNKQLSVQTALKNKIQHLHASFAEIDTAAIKERFGQIDKELEGINQYLKARGIKQRISIPEGGEYNNEFTSAEETGDFYAKYISKISDYFSHVPLGYPYFGAITSTFGHRENPFGGSNVEVHKGLDIRAPMGAPVKAMAKGTVEFAGRRGGFGNCIILKHSNGFETLYGHLSKILISAGQNIEIGQVIGKVGSTGRSTGPHLHYEVHRNGQKVNPSQFLTLK